MRKKLNKIVNRNPKHKNKFWFKKKTKPTVKQLLKIGHKEECVCCGSSENLTFDHKMPKARGGSNDLKNGQILCKRCNQFKADRRISLYVLKIEIEEAENLKSRQNLNK